MKSRTFGLVALLLLLAVGGVVLALVFRGPKASSRRTAASALGGTGREGQTSGSGTRGDDPNGGESNAEHGGGGAATASNSRIDRKHADELRERLHELFADASLAWGTVPIAEPDAGKPREIPMMPGPGADGGNSATNKYIQDRMHEDFFPMAKTCYANALVKTPALKGRFVLKYRIVGDTRVGGVVDSTGAGEGTDITDPLFTECMTQSMLSVSFDAPPAGTNELTVEYPIEFSPDDEEDGG